MTEAGQKNRSLSVESFGWSRVNEHLLRLLSPTALEALTEQYGSSGSANMWTYIVMLHLKRCVVITSDKVSWLAIYMLSTSQGAIGLLLVGYRNEFHNGLQYKLVTNASC